MPDCVKMVKHFSCCGYWLSRVRSAIGQADRGLAPAAPAHLASSPKVTKVINTSRPISRVASGRVSVPFYSPEATSVSRTAGSRATRQARSR